MIKLLGKCGKSMGFYEGKKVLITGHTGFKGTWLTKILVNMGAQVTGYSLDYPTQPSLFQLTRLDQKINHIMVTFVI